MLSPSAASRVSTPYRCRRAPAIAWRCSVVDAIGRNRSETSDQRPADAGGPSRMTGRWGSRPEHSEREERVIGDLAGPHHVPERVQHRIFVARAGRVIEVAEERRAAALQVLANPLVDLAVGPLLRLSNQPGGIGPKEECDASIGTTQRAAARPDHLAHRDQLIE